MRRTVAEIAPNLRNRGALTPDHAPFRTAVYFLSRQE